MNNHPEQKSLVSFYLTKVMLPVWQQLSDTVVLHLNGSPAQHPRGPLAGEFFEGGLDLYVLIHYSDSWLLKRVLMKLDVSKTGSHMFAV